MPPLHLPHLIPAELWKKSDRWDQYGDELLRIKDRSDREFCFGPTHEEVVTDLVSAYTNSYKQLPVLIEKMLFQEDKIKEIVEQCFDSKSFLFIGRGLNFPTALEGALKLKEISYIHATGYAAGELKHGPIALIDEDLPVVCIVPKTQTYEKMMSNIQEVNARGGKMIIIATEGDDTVNQFSDHVIRVPEVNDELTPILSVIPLQLLSYHIALKLGCDVDQPRNLAKSVTVE